jgi:hypothetical protein
MEPATETPTWLWPLIWTVVGAALSFVIERVYQWFTLRRKIRQLVAIFNFVQNELIFVVPHHDRDQRSIMPRAAFEDMMALKNIVTAITKLHRTIDIKIKDPSHLTLDDQKKDLISLGGGRVNPFSEEALLHHGLHFEQDGDGNAWILRRHETIKHESKSYAVSDDQPPSVGRGDNAVILKAPNLHNPQATVLVVAGVRGIGTWGAADFLRKRLDSVYQLKRGKKTGDFLFFVEVQYGDFDILSTEMRGFEDLPNRKVLRA